MERCREGDDGASTSSKKDDSPETSFPELLNFACRAQTLISELLTLSSQFPPQFLDPRYDPVLFDLRYFDSPNDFEAKIEGNAGLEELEDQLRETCSVFMKKFFLLANGIVVYHQELLKYLNDLQERVYGNSTLERVIEDEEGLQLLMESLALFGCLLLLMEHHMSGLLREKLLVAHLRNDRCFDVPNLEAMCLLCRVHPTNTSGSVRQVQSSRSSSVRVLVHKPEEFFLRFPFPKQVLNSVLGRLKDCDLYHGIIHYPDPEHRSVALASQAGYLYILLFYLPEMLHNEVVMREIVDRFFKDTLVVPIFMYYTVDLSLSWDAYKGAKASLSSLSFIRDQCQLHYAKVNDLRLELCSALSDRVLNRDYMLNDSQSILSLVRNCNLSLRWLLLHRTSNDKKVRDTVISAGTAHQIEEEALLSFILKTSQFEFEVNQLYTELMESKGTLWQESKGHASESMQELSEYFSESRTLSWKIKDENLMDLFKNLSAQVCSLDCTKSGNVGKKLYHMISTLKEVEQFHELNENLHIKEQISIIQKYVQNMLLALSLHDTLSTFSAISDAVYMWGFVETFTQRLHKKIKQDTSIVLSLHCLFIKFRSVLDAPILRLSQNRSSDLQFVSAYYHSEYVARICAILDIIPVMLFLILNDNVLHTLQPFYPQKRIARDSLQSFVKPGPQFHVTKAFAQISNFSKGIRVMSKALSALIDLNVKNWIEDKMRKELSKRFEEKSKSFMHPSGGLEEFEMNLQKLTTYFLSQLHLMECLQEQVVDRCQVRCFVNAILTPAFDSGNVKRHTVLSTPALKADPALMGSSIVLCYDCYLQDLIDIQGSRLWQEEFTCFLKHCAQKECEDFQRRRKHDSIAMPVEVNDFSNANTFLGYLLCEILKLTKPSRSMYIEPMSGWFDAEGCELLGLRFFQLLESCLGPVGMASLDSLLALIITENLKLALKGLKILMNARCLEQLQMLDTTLGSPISLPLLGWSSYQQMAKLLDMLWEPWVESLACIGQLQLIGCLITLTLNSACKVKARTVCSAVDGMIASISSQKEKILMGNEKDSSGTTEHFLHELSNQGTLCGLCTPLKTIYLVEDPPAFLGRCASMVTISQLRRYVLDTHLGTLTSHLKKVALDFSPVVIGLGTFLRQFHPTYLIQYVQYMGQYIRVATETHGVKHEPQKGTADSRPEALKAIFWLMYFCKHMEIPKDLVDSCLPPSLLAVLQV